MDSKRAIPPISQDRSTPRQRQMLLVAVMNDSLHLGHSRGDDTELSKCLDTPTQNAHDVGFVKLPTESHFKALEIQKTDQHPELHDSYTRASSFVYQTCKEEELRHHEFCESRDNQPQRSQIFMLAFTVPYFLSLQILELYQQYIDPDFQWENFTLEEQAEIVKAPRSNAHLDTSKVRPQFHHCHASCFFSSNLSFHPSFPSKSLPSSTYSILQLHKYALSDCLA